MRKGAVANAIASYRRAVAIDPQAAIVHANLGIALDQSGALADAIASYRRALAIDPKYASAHDTLGVALYQSGEVDEALSSLRRAQALYEKQGIAGARNGEHVAQRIQQIEQHQADQPRLLDIARGKSKASSAEEWIAAAEAAYQQAEHAAAARTYARAFVAHEELLGVEPHRYNAACSAALAGTGQGIDSKKLSEVERNKLRTRAHAWLRAKHVLEVRRVDLGEKLDEVRRRLQHWQKDADLAGVRDAARLKSLPADEAEIWGKLWRSVQVTLDRAAKTR